MTSRVFIGGTELSMPTARALALACLLLCTPAWPSEVRASPSADKSVSAALARDSARCRAHADLDACYDAIRWNPADPALLVALADAQLRAGRPADAMRNYRRAAALAPTMPGVAAKITALETKLSSKRAPRDRASGNGAPGKRYSNAAPVAQSH
jgi:cytochrome c-type biogenesis protein CcmH/NrfG